MLRIPQKLLGGMAVTSLCYISLSAQSPLFGGKLFIQNIRSINTPDLEFSPFVPADDSICFVTSRQPGKKPDTSRYFDIACTHYGAFAVQSSIHFVDRWNTPYHEGPVALDQEHKLAFVTGSYVRDGKLITDSTGLNQLVIRMLKFDGSKAQTPSFNNIRFSTAHPTLTRDGQKIFFSSNRPGGFGGMDLWYCERRDGGWSEPVHLDSTVNSPYNDVFGFLYRDSILFFASDRPANGQDAGLDIYLSAPVGSPAIRLDPPINSDYDDFGIWVLPDGKKGFFSSNRPGGAGGDDLYRFDVLRKTLSLCFTVRDVQGRPVPGASVSIQSAQGLRKIATTNQTGKICFAIPGDRKYSYRLTGRHIHELTGSVSLEQTPQTISLVAVPISRCREITGRVTSININHNLPDTRLTLRYGGSNTLKLQTDDLGVFRFCLPDSIRHYRLHAEKEGYVAFEKSFSVRDNLSINLVPVPSGITREKYVMENIYYDFDDTRIRESSAQELRNLAKILQDHPDLHIALVAYTDSRGSRRYNERLSRHRARAAKDFLVRLGIAPERIATYGRGERNIRNQCTDGVPCTEAEHQYNRRTEVIFLDNPNDINDLYYMRKYWAKTDLRH